MESADRGGKSQYERLAKEKYDSLLEKQDNSQTDPIEQEVHDLSHYLVCTINTEYLRCREKRYSTSLPVRFAGRRWL